MIYGAQSQQALRAGDATTGVCIDAINEDNMCMHFDLLEKAYEKVDFKDHPERVYNMDKTGMSLDPIQLPLPLTKERKRTKELKCGTGVLVKNHI